MGLLTGGYKVKVKSKKYKVRKVRKVRKVCKAKARAKPKPKPKPKQSDISLLLFQVSLRTKLDWTGLDWDKIPNPIRIGNRKSNEIGF